MAHIVRLCNEEYRRAPENSTLLTGCVNYTDPGGNRILKKGAGEAFSEKFFPALATKYSKTLDKSRGIWYTIVVRGYSSVGRALEWHSRGQGFDSPYLHFITHIRTQTHLFWVRIPNQNQIAGRVIHSPGNFSIQLYF